MEKLIITGGRALQGSVPVAAAKNAVLPILAASLLCDSSIELEEVPALGDVYTMLELLSGLGWQIQWRGSGLTVAPGGLLDSTPDDAVQRMRATFLVLGPLLARRGRTSITLPGGCAIGSRPVDLHLKGLGAMGARFRWVNGRIEAQVSRLVGTRVYLDLPSVGATEQLMMAATLAEGTTEIDNAAEEPEVVDLANFLLACGAHVWGAGTRTIRVEGRSHLDGCRYRVIPDRIEAGTYLMAAAMTGGDVTVEGVVVEHLSSVLAKLSECGVAVAADGNRARVLAPARPRATNLTTLPYPGFPTDLGPQFLTVLSIADGTSMFTETVFENRFLHIRELRKMGAQIRTDGRSAMVTGVPRLSAAQVAGSDLRGTAALALAALSAEGTSEVGGVEHLERGYSGMVGKLARLGGQVRLAPAGYDAPADAAARL